jgi:hypothetical protein
MTRRIIGSALLSTALAVSSMAGMVTAQEPVEPVDEVAPSTTSGTIVAEQNDDGSIVYSLQTEDGQLVQLSFGPSWFWGPLSALWPEAVEGASVEIGGNLRDGLPSEDASDVALEQAAKDPVLKVDTLNGAKRAQGKPPWAGGPKVQGPAHPGYAGWSKGQANKAAGAEKAAKPEKPGRPAHAGPKGPREDE